MLRVDALLPDLDCARILMPPADIEALG